jgi:hypothetical protein
MGAVSEFPLELVKTFDILWPFVIVEHTASVYKYLSLVCLDLSSLLVFNPKHPQILVVVPICRDNFMFKGHIYLRKSYFSSTIFIYSQISFAPE